MKDNIKFYRSMKEVDTSYFKNLESKPHQVSQLINDLIQINICNIITYLVISPHLHCYL